MDFKLAPNVGPEFESIRTAKSTLKVNGETPDIRRSARLSRLLVGVAGMRGRRRSWTGVRRSLTGRRRASGRF